MNTLIDVMLFSFHKACGKIRQITATKKTLLACLTLTLSVCQPTNHVITQQNAFSLSNQSALSNGPHEFITNNVRLWYRAAGNGNKSHIPVVYLHGGPGQGSHSFAALVGHDLEPFLKIIYFDQRGSGHSERPFNNTYSVPILVDDIEALRQQLNIPAINIIGHSFGGILALEYAAKYPDKVHKLVIAAGLSNAPWSMQEQCTRLQKRDYTAYKRALKNSETAICNPFEAYTGEAKNRFITANMFPNPIIAEQLITADSVDGMRNTGELSRAIFSQGIIQYQFKQYEKITAEVLVVAGKHDYQIGLAPQKDLANKLHHASISVYEHSGHFMFLDEKNKFVNEMETFFSL